ncbi:MAG: hypothetical protein EP330_11340 [Deltaproteobacteria bacterium]|nr:MAG: hypothetical protein EP330_11340 [Deltaproteobacteria bacterium]
MRHLVLLACFLPSLASAEVVEYLVTATVDGVTEGSASHLVGHTIEMRVAYDEGVDIYPLDFTLDTYHYGNTATSWVRVEGSHWDLSFDAGRFNVYASHPLDVYPTTHVAATGRDHYLDLSLARPNNGSSDRVQRLDGTFGTRSLEITRRSSSSIQWTVTAQINDIQLVRGPELDQPIDLGPLTDAVSSLSTTTDLLLDAHDDRAIEHKNMEYGLRKEHKLLLQDHVYIERQLEGLAYQVGVLDEKLDSIIAMLEAPGQGNP